MAQYSPSTSTTRTTACVVEPVGLGPRTTARLPTVAVLNAVAACSRSLPETTCGPTPPHVDCVVLPVFASTWTSCTTKFFLASMAGPLPLRSSADCGSFASLTPLTDVTVGTAPDVDFTCG